MSRKQVQEYLSACRLQPGDNTELSLQATALVPRFAAARKSFTVHWELTVGWRNERSQRVKIPIASVMRWAEPVWNVGSEKRRLSEIGWVLDQQGFSSGGVLSAFLEPPWIGLEEHMTTDSIVYVFAGLVTYMERIRFHVVRNGAGTVAAAGRLVTADFVHETWPHTTGVYRGFRDRSMVDIKAFVRRS